jgi:hypothetical protein
MSIAMMIQLAFQAASAAISLLQQLGYLKPEQSELIMKTLMSGLPPKEKE